MPATLTYPGVYIEEIPSGVRTITGVATSIAAFIDFFREGPLNKAVQIFGMADFGREFGGLDTHSEASYAISQFFLNGGSEAWVVRAAKDDPPNNPLVKAGVTLKADTSGGGAAILAVNAVSEGIWGNNLRVDVNYATSDPTKFFNLIATRYSGTTGKVNSVRTEKFLNLSVDPNDVRYVKRVVNDESKLIRVEHPAAGTADAAKLPAVSGTLSGDLSGLTQANFNNMSGKKLKIKIPASATAVDVTLEPSWGAGDVKNLRDLRGRLEGAVRQANAASALFTGATVEVVNDKQLRVLMGRNDESYNPSDTIEISNFGGGDTTATLLKLTNATAIGNNVQEYQLGLGAGADIAALKRGNEGADGAKPGATELVGVTADANDEGIYALRKIDLFNILCLPRAVADDISDSEMTTIVSKAVKLCEDRRAFMIIDIPASINEVQEVKDWLAGHDTLRHKNAAVYFPRPKIADPLDEFRLRSIGASGTMAGLYARTDGARGVWKAPAGTEATLTGVGEFDAKLTDPENGTLNPLAINCLRTFSVYGNVAWGARTLDGSDQAGSEWKYIPVRRLALFLEESLFRGTKWVVFEPNDEPLWAKIRLNVGAFMMSLFRQGAFQGSTPDKAFYVKCDAETTTQDDRNKGIVNIEVGFAPLKPAEFVVIKIQQIAGELE
jgi:uncharacterized protein